MLFLRSVPPRRYRAYTRYRSLLRRDFQHRCAYCLTHERYLGGEAGCAIDHHRPQRGLHARPDLEHDYANLYWTCQECNTNKGDTWPDAEEEADGMRFLDPCLPDDDHDLHWRTQPDGSVEAITPAGEYTIEHLKLWRDQLAYHRARAYRWQQERDELVGLLARKKMSPEMRTRLEARLVELNEYLEPPVFDRPRQRQS
jgi:hypothetical protein